ncbi:MAG: carbohydrate-binding protein [Clostridia bacterium]|nr:carbohydrate-binding protein [Clostridia bacterium]
MGSKVQPYADNGVVISKSSIKVGDEITVSYNGLLLKSGADKVFAHIGYGDEWNEKTFIPMDFQEGVFKATFKVALPNSLNMCFKDGVENWDNNSGENYSFKITDAAKAVKVPAEKKTTPKKAETKTAVVSETGEVAATKKKAVAKTTTKKTAAKTAETKKESEKKTEKKPASKKKSS